LSSVTQIIRRRRAKRARKQGKQGKNQLWSGVILLVAILLLVIPLGGLFGLAGFIYVQAASQLASPAETIYLDPIIGPTELYDRSGAELLYSVQDPLGDERRWIELEQLPEYVIDATLLMEDTDYLRTARFSTADTLNDLWWYMLDVLPPTDQSITGRLVRNTLLPLAASSGLDESLLEIALAAEVNRRYAPLDVLEWHLNTNYYGNDAYGIEAAAQVYLGKAAADLTVDEAALLVAIAPQPQFNPFDNETAARGRQADLIRLLHDRGSITPEQFDTAITRPTPLRTDLAQVPLIAPEFSIFARQQAQDILDSLGLDGGRMVARDGLRITTTLDLDLYYQSECVIRAHLASLNGESDSGLSLTGTPCISRDLLDVPVNVDQSSPPNQGALVVLDVATGEVKSLIGQATHPAYQPALTLHPFVYFEGFRSADFTPASMLLDIPRPFPGAADGLIYTPTNADNQFRGPINLRDAMVAGLLPPAVHVANNRGMSRVLVTAHRIGLNSLDENFNDLALLERGGNVSVLDMTYAYSVFASMGIMHGVDVEPVDRGFRSRDPVAVLRIETAAGEVLWDYDETQAQLSQTNIFDSGLGYLVNHILSDTTTRRAVLNLTDSALSINRPAAVVNGLTGDKRGSWTIGYTPQLVTGIYLGRENEASLSLDTYGLQGAAPIWQTLMRYAHERDALSPQDWQRPDDIAEFVVCEKSGLLPGNDGVCPTRSEVFITNIPPMQADTYWERHEVNSQTRQLATANTPTSLRSEFVFFVPPPEAMEWWQGNGLPLPPTEYDTLSRPEVLRSVQLLQPDDFAYVGGVVDIRGSIDTENMSFFQLAFGEDVNPAQWFEISGQQTAYEEGTSLSLWDTSTLNGVYTLRLSVVYEDGSIDSDFRMVTVDNVPPNISLIAGEPDKIFRYPAESVIPLAAEVVDNLAIDRVEFYRGAELIGIDEEWPYGFDFAIENTGFESFTATAFDQVGNSTTTQLEVEIIRSG